MKVKSAILAAMTGAMFGAALTVRAEDGNATVTFTADRELTYSNVTANDDGSVNLGDAFEGVAPGETRSETITLANAYDSEVDFYMSTEVLQTLEESGDAARGAGYDVVLAVGESELYNSAVGGYASESASGDSEGLNALNDSELQDSVLVATLSQGENADIVLTITFDGEAMDNADEINYADALGNIAFSFRAGYQDPTGTTEVVRTETETTETRYITEIIEEQLPLAVRTGDNAFLLGGVLVLATGIILFLLTGRKNKKEKESVTARLTLLALGAAACVTLCGGTAQAADAYTVTYRPGDVGQFATGESDTSDAQAAAEEVAALLYGDYEYTVTEHGAIKLTVLAGAAVPAAPSYIVAENGYFVRSTDTWGPAADETVTRNMDFVVDYGKLVDGVTYTVRYVDAQSGAQIAPVSIASGNAGDTVNMTAPATITVSSATRYTLSGEATASLTLTKDADNVLTFSYTAEPTGVNETVITETVDGGTVVTTQTVQVGVQDQTNAGAVLAPGQADADAAGGQDANIDNNVVIEDENTPLADGETDNVGVNEMQNATEEIVDNTPVETIIDDETAPLAHGVESAAWWILGVAAAALVVVTVLWIRFNRKS